MQCLHRKLNLAALRLQNLFYDLCQNKLKADQVPDSEIIQYPEIIPYPQQWFPPELSRPDHRLPQPGDCRKTPVESKNK